MGRKMCYQKSKIFGRFPLGESPFEDNTKQARSSEQVIVLWQKKYLIVTRLIRENLIQNVKTFVKANKKNQKQFDPYLCIKLTNLQESGEPFVKRRHRRKPFEPAETAGVDNKMMKIWCSFGICAFACLCIRCATLLI